MELGRRRLLKLGAFATVVALGACTTASGPAPTVTMPGSKVEVQWLGQSTTKITSPGGKVIVIDPFMTGNPKTPAEHKDLTKLGKVDLILVTHGHSDHTGDVAALHKLTGGTVAGNSDLVYTMIALGWVPADKAIRFNMGGSIRPLGPGITITMVPATHSSDISVTDPATKKLDTHSGGEACGFIVELENGFRIYHMGDTALFSDMRLIGRYYAPDLVMIPIGGHFVMDPAAAAFATNRYLKPKYAIPFHYGTIPVLAGTPQQYQQALGQSSTRVFPLNPGDKLTFPL